MRDFTAFKFGNVHTKDLHLIVVSSNKRYEKALLPNNKDYSTEIPGGDGSYYFGSSFTSVEFKVDVAFDSVDEKTWRKISNLFSTDKLKDLVFDELPYKTYKAKLKSKPEFKCLCFTDKKTGERVYKGEGTLIFICYQPFAYCFNKYIIRAADNYQLTLPCLNDNINTKEFYNVENNMNTPWKGGYPTIEQVQAGELYFKDENDNKKIIDVRRYFKNVPEWAESSKLLTTPTLDYQQDLIFLPQYSKVDYINMDIGFNNNNAMIGSRILVYNPGDISIEFKLKMENIKKSFHTTRGKHFQIRRFNVQRLSLANAVDWTGLRTHNEVENISHKYGNKYFKIIEAGESVDGVVIPDYVDLKDKHPKHAFIAEPIPRELLGHYIRLFYWQSSKIKESNISYEEGENFANRYEELYDLCVDDEEKYELYWKTLKTAILDVYKEKINNIENGDFNEFVYNYIHNPPEFINKNLNLLSNQEDFNFDMMPKWYTKDFLEINTNDIENTTLFLDSEKKMLYNIISPEYKNMYDYKPSKKNLSDNIEKGCWFKIPVGWSLIEITPVCEEDNWGGKKWDDARPFDWGYKEEDREGIQSLFNKVYQLAAEELNIKNLNFRKIENYGKDSNGEYGDKFIYEYFKTQEIQSEYKFLKKLQELWKLQKGKHKIGNEEIEIKGTIDEWWWYACNYIWASFPPLYWSYADILNKAEIEYTPLFY
jgi:hypothetical protein